MKKPRILFLFLVLWSMFSSIMLVHAASATVGFSSNSTVPVGQQITVKMYISNVQDTVGGIVSAGGNLSFDSSYLEYVSGTGISSPYSFQINESANYIVAGLDTTLSNGIKSETTVFTFVFKALKKGTTEVTLTNAKLSDTDKKITSTVSGKTITITDDETPGDTGGGTTTPEPTKSSDATLKSLVAQGYTLSPTFSSSTTSYTVKVPSGATSVILDGTPNNSKATVSGLGSVTLTGNETTATVKVTAEDGTTKNYTLKFVKESSTTETKKDSDATLKSLNVSGYTLSPSFDKNVNTYSIKVSNSVTGLDVSAIPTSDKAKVTISGNKNWKEGNNVVTIKVTAEDGSTNVYIVNVERASSNKTTETTKSSDNYLKNLTINSAHEMGNSFNKDTSVYNITVPYEVDKLDLSAIANNSKAKVEITGNESFKVGEVNTVLITVTAENGAVRTYTLNVTRTAQKSNATLKDLTVKEGTLSPKFDPEETKYTIKVDGSVDKLDISAIPTSENSKVEIIGNENLKEGKNTVIVSVTDENGFTRNYVLEVEKEASKGTTIFGLTPLQFILALAGILIPLFLLLLLLLLLLKRRKKEKEKEKEYRTPIIEVKPEFNFSSKNTSDDDVVHGNLTQESTITNEDDDDDEEYYDDYEDYDEFEDKFPYDPFDETVTKKEIVDAIHEAMKTKDSSKLKMLLEQDNLNQKKKAMKKK